MSTSGTQRTAIIFALTSRWTLEVPLLPPSMIVELSSAVADKLDERQKIQLINECARWDLSNILHGEQGALALSCSLCDMFVDPGAQEYMANQVREEARHVHGFTKYIQARFGGRIYPAGDTLSHLLRQLVASTEVYEKSSVCKCLWRG